MLTKETVRSIPVPGSPTIVAASSVPWLSCEGKSINPSRKRVESPIYFDFLSSEERIKMAEVALSGSFEALDLLGGSGKDSQWGKRGVGVFMFGDYESMIEYVKRQQKMKLQGVIDRLPIWC